MKRPLFLSPHFPAKRHLMKDISSMTTEYSFTGDIIDIGCGVKPYKKYFDAADTYRGIDFRSYSDNPEFRVEKPDYYFSKHYRQDYLLPFENNVFHHAVSFQVLEHHPKPEVMIREMVRVTKKNGYILLSFPFIWALHEEPNDYYRFTEYSIANLFQDNGCKVIRMKKQGAVCSVIATLLSDALIEFSKKNKLTYLLSVLLYPIVMMIAYLSLIGDKLFPTDTIFLNYVWLAKKL